MTSKSNQLQRHFYFNGLTSNLMTPARDDDADRNYEVQGKRATSNEYYVALALEELNIEYDFQLSFAGGKVAFGLVLDFMASTNPLPTPIWVHGEHWHMGDRKEKDLRQQQIVEELMGGMVNPAVVIWGQESNSREMALKTVRRYLA